MVRLLHLGCHRKGLWLCWRQHWPSCPPSSPHLSLHWVPVPIALLLSAQSLPSAIPSTIFLHLRPVRLKPICLAALSIQSRTNGVLWPQQCHQLGAVWLFRSWGLARQWLYPYTNIGNGSDITRVAESSHECHSVSARSSQYLLWQNSSFLLGRLRPQEHNRKLATFSMTLLF